jgi:hypothetical protein
MSGWGVHDYAGAALAALFLLTGLSSLLRRPQAGGSWWNMDRLYGAMMILIGLEHVRDPGRFTDSPVFNFGVGGLVLAFALWLLLIHPVFQRQRQREYEAGLAALTARSQAYSPPLYEAELHAMQAKAPVSTPVRDNVRVAAFLFLLGGFFLALGLIPAR